MWWVTALLLTVQGGAQGDLSAFTWVPFPREAFRIDWGSSLRAAARTESKDNPACYDDVCQPRVAVPGVDPKFDIRGKRTEFALAVLDRLNVGPVSSLARAIAMTGVRLDYTPPQIGDTLSARTSFGSVNVFVRWRLDAFSAPVWMANRP
jgi:hypothetical protein